MSAIRARWSGRYAVALAVVLAVALGLRLWGVRSGLPWAYNVDEAGHFVPNAVGMLGGDLNPGLPGHRYFANPPAFSYLLALLYEIWFGGQAALDRAYLSADPSTVFVLGRIAAGVLGTLSVWLLYLAGARLTDRRTGLLAAAIMAVAFLPVFYGKLALNDAPVLVGVCLSLWGSAGVARDGRRRDFLLAGLGLGLAAATKYTGGIVVLALLAAGLARARARPERVAALGWLAVAAITALAVFVALNPYSILDWHDFEQGLIRQSSQTGAGNSKLGLTHGSGIRYYLWSITWGVGWVPAVAAIAGAGVLARVRARTFAMLVPMALIYLVAMGVQGRYFGRWVMPIVPVICLLAAVAAVAAADLVSRRPGRIRAALLGTFGAALCAQGLAYSIHSGVVNSRADTRNTARAWLLAHVRAHSHIVVEPFVPLGVPHDWSAGFATFPDDFTHRTAGGGLAVFVPRGGRGSRLEPAGAPVSIEDYERTLTPALIGLYRRNGYCWVVTGSTEAGRASVDPNAVPGAVAYYAALAAQARLVFVVSPYRSGSPPVPFNFDWSFDYYPASYARPGPLIAIYRLRGGRCAGASRS